MSQQPDERVIGHANSLVRKRRGAISWIWEGVLADEAITLLSAPEKVGKTTLLSVPCHCQAAGMSLGPWGRGQPARCTEVGRSWPAPEF
jgi:hypothetical protein